MGTNVLTARTDGDIIPAADHNELVEALGLDFVPRNASRVPTDLAGQLGTSALRWLSVFAQDYFVGDAANNLKIEEPSAGVIKIGNSNNDYVLISDGKCEFYTNNVVRWRVNDSGVDWTIISNLTVPRNVMAHKNFQRSSIFDSSESSSSPATKQSFSFSFLQGRTYKIGLVGGHILTGVNTGAVYLRVDGTVIDFESVIGGSMQVPANVERTYVHTAASGSLTVDIQLSSTGGSTISVEDVRLICWEL